MLDVGHAGSHTGDARTGEGSGIQLCPILCDPKDCSPPASSVHANNKPYTVTGFADKALADAKVLRVTAPTNTPQHQQTIVAPTIQTPQPQQKQIDTSKFVQAAQQSVNDLLGAKVEGE